MSDKASIYRAGNGLWILELPGGRSPQGATSFAGVLELWSEVSKRDAWWKSQDPLQERPADAEEPRRTIAPPPPTSWWARFVR